jgi:predicted enzyme involved in methoxymalonyl-ACP biosynthesis
LSVKDKFGDNGITVVSIIKINGDIAEVDSYLLSCRILGRGIEFVYLKYLLNKLWRHGIKTIRASYLPSSKNRQVKDFYDKIGFVLQEEKNDGAKHYILKMEEPFEIKSYYRIIES